LIQIFWTDLEADPATGAFSDLFPNKSFLFETVKEFQQPQWLWLRPP
jgi:hypothetical protein